MPQEELDVLYKRLNNYLVQYFNNYISNIISNLDTLLANYEYEPNEWDTNRAIESGNIFSKLAIVLNSKDYLIQLGMDAQEVDTILKKINDRHYEIHKPYENKLSKKERDIDFLSAAFCDLNMIWQTIEYDLQKQITEEEAIALYTNVDYMIKLFEKYVTIAENEKFKFDNYDISKEDLQQLLNEIIENYQNGKKMDAITGFDENQDSGIKI